jgi:pimeloyl-ACP methyl ester carboxylesterase
MSATRIVLIWACCGLAILLPGGCVGIPGSNRPEVDRDKIPLDAHSPEDAVPEETGPNRSPGVAQAAPFLVPQARPFPEQGWWCHEYGEWLAPERAQRGYTIILPGIEGTSWFNISIARGLVDAGHEAAIEIYDWTTHCRLMFAYHLMALERNREQARLIAEKIVAYQDRFPDRPVCLVGHSGGAALAVLVLEALPEDRRVTQTVLLACALSPDYDLSTALRRSTRGITSFRSGGDLLYLGMGTLALGTIDRQHVVSAGTVGFRTPSHLTPERQEWYESRLHEVPYRLEMLRSFNLAGHFGPVNRRFVAEWVAPTLTVPR